MDDNIFTISFELEGQHYSGWVVPSDKLNKQGRPDSFHVIVNEVSFGYLSFYNCQWVNFEKRSSCIIELIGKQIDNYYKVTRINPVAETTKQLNSK